ncbi:hypothetical protein [Salinigranum rubrum]|nr:hypothetical protein [Salinigranum rubrum]
MAAAEPMDGKGNDVPTLPPSLYSLDGKGNDPLPPTLSSLDGKGNDVPTLPPSLYSLAGIGNDATINAFPINNVTAFTAAYVGRGGGSGKPSF